MLNIPSLFDTKEQTLEAIDAAYAFLESTFPHCDAAFLAGSVMRGEATATSDLDIVVVTKEVKCPYRESLFAFGWPIEVFVHTHESYHTFFASDIHRRRPSLPRMCAEGLILKDTNGIAQQIKDEARNLFEQGPEPLPASSILQLRYQLTDVLDDFIGSLRRDESLFIANEVALLSSELILGYHCRWIGKGKWALRALHAFDPTIAERLTSALEAFYQQGTKDPLITYAQEALTLVGGRSFEGYSSQKAPPKGG